MTRPLKDQIEVDTIDNDLTSHLEHFISSFREKVSLAEFDLLTQESAEKAVEAVMDTQKRIEEQMAIVKSLKKLLEAKQY